MSAAPTIAVHHVDNHDGADEVGAALTTRLPQIESLTVADMGPVLSIHLGAGAIGVVVQTAEGRSRDATKQMARDERTEFAAFLRGLRPEQWESPTLCEQWRVRDVAIHTVSYDELSTSGLVSRFLRGRLSTDRINAIGVADYADWSPEQIVGALRVVYRTERPDGGIRRPDRTHRRHDPPAGHPSTARPATRHRSGTAAHRARFRPVRADQSRGDGAPAACVWWPPTSTGHSVRGDEVRGTGEALLMAMAGRRAALDDLDGPGKARLAAHF